jgi:hypothetical protein
MSNSNATEPIRRESFATRAIAAIAALVLIGLPVFVVAREHLAAPNLWFDESLQFFLSLGLEHFAAPNAPRGGWGKLVEYSRYLNGDPGGFTALLRFWMAFFGYSPVALRSLPFLFFLLTPIIIFLSARRAGINAVIATLAASIPLGFPVLLHYATEVRPYSMETCAVASLFFLPCWLLDKPRDWVIVILGCAGAFLITSHYSAFVYGAAACLVALLPIRSLRSAVLRASRFAIPLIIAVAACYLIFARYQFGNLITGGGRIAPVFEPLVLSGKDSRAVFALLRENFLEPGALPVTIYLLGAPVFVWLGPRSLPRLRSLVARTFVFCELSVTFVVLASMAGKLPWAWPTRWSIGYQTLSACCLAMIVIAVGTCLWQKTAGWPWKVLVIAAIACFVVAWSMQLERAVRSEHPYYETIASHLQALASSGNAKSLRFFVQINATPTTRYLVEYGPLKGAFNYPMSFYFETQQEAKDKPPISAKEHDIIVLTHSQFSDAYRARIVDGTAEIIAMPPPSSLLVINK